MATSMRITAFVLLVLVVASPTPVSSSQRPFPVTCLERCADADCVDACQREAEIETAGEFPAEKRASAFVRIGRPSAFDRRTSSFIRIGKKSSPVEAEADKRKDSFVRIGRASAFVRIGRGSSDESDGTKRASSFVRIGKSSKPEDSAIEVDTNGNKRASSSFVRIGRDDHGFEPDETWLPRRW